MSLSTWTRTHRIADAAYPKPSNDLHDRELRLAVRARPESDHETFGEYEPLLLWWSGPLGRTHSENLDAEPEDDERLEAPSIPGGHPTSEGRKGRHEEGKIRDAEGRGHRLVRSNEDCQRRKSVTRWSELCVGSAQKVYRYPPMIVPLAG